MTDFLLDPAVDSDPWFASAPASTPLSRAPLPIRAIQQTASFSPIPRIAEFGGQAQLTPITKQLPDNTTALQNKWSDPDVLSAINQLSAAQRQALIDLDAERVSRGSTPLSKDDTIRTVQTLVTNRPATAPAERSVWNVPGNLVANLTETVKAIPKLPVAAIQTLTHLGQVPDTYGDNQLANLLSAPGVNLIPGSYILSQLARGGQGVQELARNPLYTALDVLPAASKLAEGTRVAQAARVAAEAGDALGTTRPLLAVATRRLDDAGRLELNQAGQVARNLRDETRVGQAIDQAFGGRARDLAREQGRLENQARAIRDSVIDDGSPEGALLARSQQLRARADEYGWTPEQRARITAIATGVDRTPLSALEPQELAYINEARDLATSYGNLLTDRGELARVLFPDGTAEFYDTRRAGQFERLKQQRETATTYAAMREKYLSDQATLGPLDREELTRYQEFVDALPKKQRTVGQRAVDAYVEAHGYDSKQWRKDRTLGDARELMPTDELVANLRSFRLPGGQQDPHAYALAQALATRDIRTIRREAQTLAGRVSKATPATDPRFVDTIRSLARRYSADLSIGDQTANVRRASKQLDDLAARAAPARFEPVLAANRDAAVGARAQQLSEAAIGRKLTGDEVARVAQVVQEQTWAGLESLGVGADDLRRLHSNTTREVVAGWQELKDQGVDPVFVHSTSVSRARSVDNPSITSQPNALSQTKERKLDISQGIGDLGVSLTQQGMEILTRRLRTEFRDWVGAKYGVPQSQLAEMYAGQARELALADPRLSVRGHLERLISRSWRDLDEAFTGPGMAVYQDKVYVPVSVANNLKPIIPSSLTASMNRVTGTFRVAVTSLSVRNLLYNALGGAVMTAGEAPGALAYLGKARELVKNPELIVSQELRASLGGLGRDIREQLTAHPEIQAQVLAGRTLGRIFGEVQSWRESSVARGVKTLSEKSVSMNGTMDDMYRVSAYLSGEQSALRKGLSAAEAERAGLELARKVMMDYTSLTPFERSTMRAIFPFYSFTSHIMRYVMRYPIDHPLRASIITAFGRAEAEDNATLPQSFLSSFIFGRPGDEKRVDVGAANPFGDAANMFTLAGFLSATNPILSTVLEQAGLVQGAAELYPTLRYDPESGRLSATRGNPLLQFIENTVPQSTLLTSLLGVNAEFRDRMARDPEGASRMLMSTLGLPINMVPRDVNVPGEVAKAEVARYDSQANALNDALKTGNWSEARRYPGLSADYQRMLDASPSELAAYIPQGADIYQAMIEQAMARQQQQARANARAVTT